MLGAFAFLTLLGRGAMPDQRSLRWFGAVGVVVGAVCGLVRWGAGGWWPPAIAAALTVAADLALTGLLHLDGLADTADGLLPPMERGRRLTVMATPGVGAFALGAVGVVLLLRWTALTTMPISGWHWVALLAGTWCGARTAMAVIITAVPYARPRGGMATAFRGASPWLPLLIGLPLAVVGATTGRGVGGVVGLAAGALGAAAVTGLARARLGGFTGDTAGAAGLVFETVALVVAAARW
jgi:adenosylcobinamide-GDP ribazoletransferase